jgi:hypothetical protein
MKTLICSIVALAAALACSPAHANECSTTTYGSYQSAYPYTLLNATATDKPVLQGGVTLSCNNWWLDVWGSKDLTGHERFGNEVYVTGAYASSLRTSLGTFEYEAAVGYDALPDFARTKDDIVEFRLELALPLSFGSITVKPYIRPTGLIGFGVYENTMLIRSGVRFTIPVAQGVSLVGDAFDTQNLTNGNDTRRFYGSVKVNGGNGWSFKVGGKFAEREHSALEIGFSKTF